MSNLTIASLHKDFGETRILHDIDLSFTDGEFVALVSPSGCGASPCCGGSRVLGVLILTVDAGRGSRFPEDAGRP